MSSDQDSPRVNTGPKTDRAVDMSAMLRLMRPLNGSSVDLVAGKRRLLADLCRFIGVQVGSLSPDHLAQRPEATVVGPLNAPIQSAPRREESVPSTPQAADLSPRLEQTLQLLLNGYSEKQVARKLQLSQHTVHDYVKTLYRKCGVSSRAELLALILRR